MLEGLPELQELNMYGNKVAEIIIPHSNGANKRPLLSKLETLNLGYNDLSYLPDDLDLLKSLRTLKVMNNFLEKVPIRVCDMDLRMIDVSSNPVIQPPIETCERGISSMKRYYHCLRMEENQPAFQSHSRPSSSYYDGFQKNVKKTTKKVSYGLLKAPKLLMPGVQRPPSSASQPAPLAERKRQVSDEASMSQSSVATVPSGVTQSQSANLPSSPTSSPTPFEGKAPSVAARSKSEGDEPAVPAPRQVLVDEEGPISPQRASYSLGESAESSIDATSGTHMYGEALPQHQDAQVRSPESITVNDTLKVIFVGMAMVGKTSMIKRLIEGENAIIPSHDDRTVGVDIYEWDNRKDKRFEDIDSRIIFEDKELERSICKAAGIEKHNVDVKFSVWDFAGQHVYHATHQLFFSPRALYVLVWDMGATNRGTLRRKNSRADERGAFKLNYDGSDEEDSEEDDDFDVESEARRAERALDRDIDEKVQFWVDCIQSSAPGAAILPVASFNDHFNDSEGGVEEAKRRCRILKNRLLRHEERRIEGIKHRLKEYHDSNRANDEGAVRLQKLLDSYTRPKLIFWDDDDPVVRVSGSMYTGFDNLTEKIIDIATGRYKGKWQHPIFRGHIGARIPRMRLEVREAVRTLRNRFKVVEWGYFLDQLKDRGLTSVEDISDALHFLTNVGELSYFGAVYTDKQTKMTIRRDERRKAARAVCLRRSGGLCVCAFSSNLLTFFSFQYHRSVSEDSEDEDLLDEDDYDEDDYDDDDEEGDTFLSVDDTNLASSAQITEESSLTNSVLDWNVNGLSQFVFLNPRWLVAAVACILRHDLDREIQETRRSLNAPEKNASILPNFYDAHLNCPVITARDAKMLWQAKKITKKAADRALKASSNMTVTPFEFLLLLLIRFGVFVPIDLSIEKALLGGKDYAGQEDDAPPSEVSIGDTTKTAPTTAGHSPLQARFFFLPSLLGPGEPAEAWTYKTSESWKITLAHSVLFPDGVPPGLMERITASVLSNVYAVSHKSQESESSKGRLTVKEVLCWRTAFYLKLGTQSSDNKESIVEIFTHLVDRDSNLCVGSDYMGIGMRRLITSAKGQVGDRGRKIWEGGYLLVYQSVRQVMEEFGGLEFERQAFCTDCLALSSLSRTSAWDFTVIRAAVQNGDGTLRCRDGHRVDTCLIAGPSNEPKRIEKIDKEDEEEQSGRKDPVVPVKDLLRGVVVVGLFDGKTRKVVRVGSGFVVDKKRGLIVTASHTLMNIWGDKNTPFGENYYGLRQGKVVIGVIPRQKEAANNSDSTMALFRYFAVIVAKDPSIDRGECHLDACVLRITTRMENDVGGDGDGCGDQPERLLLNNPDALKKEKLQPLKITEKVELDEQVRILGYNQGGEGLLGPGQSLNRYVDFARGYVCKMFSGDISEEEYQRHRFKPRKEIVVICPTIGGHSGGPCVNQQGEVIGILSRADPAESQRCYLVPTYEWKFLVKQAKNMI
jgi:GTPase SAR1 family protein